MQAPHGTIDIGPEGRPAGLEIFSLDHLIRTARFREPPSLHLGSPAGDSFVLVVLLPQRISPRVSKQFLPTATHSPVVSASLTFMEQFDVFHPQEALKSEASVTIRGRTLGTNLQ